MIESLEGLNYEAQRWVLGAIVGAILADGQVDPTEEASLQMCLEEADDAVRAELTGCIESLTAPEWVFAGCTIEPALGRGVLRQIVLLCVGDGAFDESEKTYIRRLSAALGDPDLADPFIGWGLDGLAWAKAGDVLVGDGGAA